MRPWVSVIALFTIVASSACGSSVDATAIPPQVVQDGDTVQVHYYGTLDSGEVFDSSRERDPLTFLVGAGQMIPGFEDAVRGLASHAKHPRPCKAVQVDALRGAIWRIWLRRGLTPRLKYRWQQGDRA